MRYIAIEEFCNHHGVETRLVREFADFGLVSLHVENNREFVPDSAITRLERTLRLFRDLEVNKEGIEVILHMRKELKKLRRKQEKLRHQLAQLEHQQLLNWPGTRTFITDEAEFE